MEPASSGVASWRNDGNVAMGSVPYDATNVQGSQVNKGTFNAAVHIGDVYHISRDSGTEGVQGTTETKASGIAGDFTQARKLTPLEKECLKTLAFPEMEHRELGIASATSGTCSWPFRHPVYMQWLRQSSGLLWIKGQAGAGKSTLLKHILKHQSDHGSIYGQGATRISFFFHGRGSLIQRSPMGLFRALNYQTLRYFPEYNSELLNRYDERCNTIGRWPEKWDWHLAELQEFFKTTILEISSTQPVSMFVDALDECEKDDAADLVKTFHELTQNGEGSLLKICIACRHYPIQTLRPGLEIYVERENGDDITTYLQSELDEDERSGRELASLISTKSAGSFQWAFLVCKRVLAMKRSGRSDAAIREEIGRVPPTLKTLYKELIEGIEPEDVPTALKLFQWVSLSGRPITLVEMNIALAIDSDYPLPGEDVGRLVYVPNEDLGALRRAVTTLSCGLLTVLSVFGGAKKASSPPLDHLDIPRMVPLMQHPRDYIEFIHESVREYFLKDGLMLLSGETCPVKAIERGHDRLSRSCLRYFWAEESKRYIVAKERKRGAVATIELRDRSFTHTRPRLLRYVANFWLYHEKLSYSSPKEQDSLLECLEWPSKNRLVHLHRLLDFQSTSLDRQQPFLHFASFHGLIRLLESLSRRTTGGLNINSKLTLHGLTPLLIAAERHHTDFLRFLLQQPGIQVNAKDGGGRTAFVHTMICYDMVSCELLLARDDLDICATDCLGMSPLSIAVWNGNLKAIELLLRCQKVDPNSSDSEGGTPLQRAAASPDDAMARLLLKRNDIDVGRRDRRGMTVLHHAAAWGRTDTLELFLARKDLDPNSKDSSLRTPLFCAVQGGHVKVVRRLLAIPELKVDTSDSLGRTPLAMAVKNEKDDIIKIIKDFLAGNTLSPDEEPEAGLIDEVGRPRCSSSENERLSTNSEMMTFTDDASSPEPMSGVDHDSDDDRDK